MSCFVAVVLYLKYYDGSYDEAEGVEIEGTNKIYEEMLWIMFACLCGLFLTSSLAFVWLIDRKYLDSFFSTATGPQFAVVKYNTATTDFQRMNVLKYYPTYYDELKVQVQELIDENWEDWMKDRPEWLTDNVIASIPDEYLPKTEVNRLEDEGGGKRRRSSVFA